MCLSVASACLQFVRRFSHRSAGQRISTFRGDRQGAAAVEFALILSPLLVFMLALSETALNYLTGTAIENSLDSAMRTLYTETASASHAADASTLDLIRRQVCEGSAPLVQCDDLRVDLAFYASFADVVLAHPINPSTGTWREDFGRQRGCSSTGSIVIARVALARKTIFPLGPAGTGFSDGSRLFHSAASVQLERNSSNDVPC